MVECIYPGKAWRKSTPQAQGMDAKTLRAIKPGVIANAVVIRHGYEVQTYGDAGRKFTAWSSCSRSFLTTLWGQLITYGAIPGGMAALDDPVRALGTKTAQTFRPAVKLKHLLSYTSCANPPGSTWRYSCGDDWLKQHQILEELTGETVQKRMQRELLNPLGGGLRAARKKDDDTNRVHGSCRDMARWGYLWLHGGVWRDGQVLVDAPIVARAIAGGPDGDGEPEPREGYQIHKVYRGTCLPQDGPLPIPHVPDDCFFAAANGAFIAVVPSLDLVVARFKGKGLDIGDWLGLIVKAVQS